MKEHGAAVIFLSVLGSLFIGSAGWIAWDEYETLRARAPFSTLMEGFIWKTVITLAVIGLGLVIWASQLRSHDRE